MFNYFKIYQFLFPKIWQHISLAQCIHLSNSSGGHDNTSWRIFCIWKLGGLGIFDSLH